MESKITELIRIMRDLAERVNIKGSALEAHQSTAGKAQIGAAGNEDNSRVSYPGEQSESS